MHDAEWLKALLAAIAAAVGGAYWRIWVLGQDLGAKADAKTVAAALEAHRNTESALNARIERRVGRDEGDELWRQMNSTRDRLAEQIAIASGIQAEVRAVRESQVRIERLLDETLKARRGE